jgi:AbrB family looped-hinge helix DNA binding protein
MNATVEIAALSSKGQIVIPQSVRKNLHLEAGVKFMVFAEQGGIFLKPVEQPKREEIDAFFSKMDIETKQLGINENDVLEAVKSTRAESKK